MGKRAVLNLTKASAGTRVSRIRLRKIYARATRPKNLVGKASLWAYGIVLAGLYLGDAASPAPSNISVVAWMGPIGWLFVLWALWIDNNGEVPSL